MNELDLIRLFRKDIPAADGADASAARATVLAAMGDSRDSDRPRRAPRGLILAAAAVLALPAGYAVADGVGIVGDDQQVVHIDSSTAEPAPAPGSEPAPGQSEVPDGIRLSPQARDELAPTDPALGGGANR